MDDQGTEKMQILAEAEASPVSVYSVPRTAIYYSLSESELRMLERGYSSVSLAVATTCGGIFATTALGLLTLHLDTRPFAVSVAICVATGFVALTKRPPLVPGKATRRGRVRDPAAGAKADRITSPAACARGGARCAPRERRAARRRRRGQRRGRKRRNSRTRCASSKGDDRGV